MFESGTALQSSLVKGKGSARSIPGVDIHQVLSSAEDLLEKFGGHKAAAGLTIKKEKIDAFAQRASDAVESQVGCAPYLIEFAPELSININEIDLSWTDALETLEFFWDW